MSQLIKRLPEPLESRVVYDSVMVENPSYDPVERLYTARVYGVCQGVPMPLIVRTALAVRRIEDVTIADAEIDAILSIRPDLNGDRITAALTRAFERLYAMATETAENPYHA